MKRGKVDSISDFQVQRLALSYEDLTNKTCLEKKKATPFLDEHTLIEVQIYTCGSNSNPPLILLHGFMQDALVWVEVAQFLAENYYVIMFDWPGHGATFSSFIPEAFSFTAHESVLKRVIDKFGCPVALVGYSMGGRIAAQFSIHYPGYVSALVLESAGLGPCSEDERISWQKKNEALAYKLKNCDQENEGFVRFVSDWENLPLFASQKKLPPYIQEKVRAGRLANNPQALAFSLRYAGQHTMEQKEHIEANLLSSNVPLLYMAGTEDVAYTKIARGLYDYMQQRLLGKVHHKACKEVRIVAGAGHNIHLERPDEYCRIVQSFLAKASLKNSNESKKK